VTPGAVAVLEVAGLVRAFDGVRALDGVDLAVARGEMVALIGPNGAGKTTCFNVIDGQLRADAGHVRVAGRAIDGLAPDAIARRGIGRTFQIAATFASMSVRENVEVARRALGRPSDTRSVDALLGGVGAGALAGRHAAILAYGDAKRVELALALAGEPHLLLLDEPTAGLAAADRGALMRVVRTRVDVDGVAVLFTEHDMDVVFAFADRVVVLDRGHVIAQGTPDAVRANAEVRRAYLGDNVIPANSAVIPANAGIQP
jgi:branched-chain amino acid transport system ATP-binding protein